MVHPYPTSSESTCRNSLPHTCRSWRTAPGREYSLAVGADSTGSTRPGAAIGTSELAVRERTFAACGITLPWALEKRSYRGGGASERQSRGLHDGY